MEDMLSDIGSMQGEIDSGLADWTNSGIFDLLGTSSGDSALNGSDWLQMSNPDISDLINFGDPLGNLDDTDYSGIINDIFKEDEFNDNTLSQFLNGTTNIVGSANDGSITGGNVNPAGSFGSSSNSGILKTVKDALSKAVGGDKNAQLLMSAIIAGIKSKQASSANNAGKNAIMATINRGDSARAGATPQGTTFGVPKVAAQQVTPATNGIYSPTNLGMSRG
jgi:hypothetical protein